MSDLPSGVAGASDGDAAPPTSGDGGTPKKRAVTKKHATGTRKATARRRPARPAVPPKPRPPLVHRDAIKLWTVGILRWLHDEEPTAPGTSHLARAITAWIDVLRIAGTERSWRHDLRPIHVGLGKLTKSAIPALLDRGGSHPRESVAVAMARLELAIPDIDPELRKAADAVWTSLLVLVDTDAPSRLAVLDWAEGARLGPARRRALAGEFGTVPETTAPAMPQVPKQEQGVESLGLFDAATVPALAESERARAAVRAVLERALLAVDERGGIGSDDPDDTGGEPDGDDRFLVDLKVDGTSISYVQGLIEDSATLHLEIGHPTLLEHGPAPDRLATLRTLGWQDPQEGLPNPWIWIPRVDLAHDEVAEFLVRSMEVLHDAFTSLPADAELVVHPLEVGSAATAGNPIHSVDLGDGRPILMSAHHHDVNVVPAASLQLLVEGIRARIEPPVARTEELARVLLDGVEARRGLLAARGAPVEPALDTAEAVARAVIRIRGGSPSS